MHIHQYIVCIHNLGFEEVCICYQLSQVTNLSRSKQPSICIHTNSRVRSDVFVSVSVCLRVRMRYMCTLAGATIHMCRIRIIFVSNNLSLNVVTDRIDVIRFILPLGTSGFDVCDSNPCEHFGRCESMKEGVFRYFLCHCSRGYWGLQCESMYSS